jgi:hypothetical protein
MAIPFERLASYVDIDVTAGKSILRYFKVLFSPIALKKSYVS